MYVRRLKFKINIEQGTKPPRKVKKIPQTFVGSYSKPLRRGFFWGGILLRYFVPCLPWTIWKSAEGCTANVNVISTLFYINHIYCSILSFIDVMFLFLSIFSLSLLLSLCVFLFFLAVTVFFSSSYFCVCPG